MNFGWSACEGNDRFNNDQLDPTAPTPPIYEYAHGTAAARSAAACVYRGAAIPALRGWYVYGDYCAGRCGR